MKPLAMLGLVCGMTFLVSCGIERVLQPTATTAFPITQPQATEVLITSTSTTEPKATIPNLTSTNTPSASPETPTLSVDERRSAISDLLLHPPCALPCWWSIDPGKSLWSEAEAWITHVGAATVAYSLTNGQIAHGIGRIDLNAQNIYNSVILYDQSGVVVSIYVRSEGWANTKGWQATWNNYAPSTIIREYGTPSRVWISIDPSSSVGDNSQIGYTLWLFFDQMSFVIEYSGIGTLQANYHVCPVFSNGDNIGSLKMVLQNPDMDLPLEQGLELGPSDYHLIRSIEDTSELSIADFALLVQSDNSVTCFDARIDAWS
jgi:hypothetical protein